MSGSVVLIILVVLGNLLFVKSFSLGQKVFKYEVDAISNGFYPHTFLNKRALGPCVPHLRMTDQWSGTICEISLECIMRNNSVKLF